MKPALLLALLGLLLWPLAPQPALAQGPIKVLDSSAQGDFPNAITFTLEAESGAAITQVSLRFRAKAKGCAPSFSTAQPAFTPGTRVSARWRWELKKAGGLPPSSLVEYSWEIADSAGARLVTEWQTFQFGDNRYRWREMAGRGVTLHWYQGDEAFARELLEAAQASLDTLARDAGARLEGVAHTFIYGSSEEFRSALIFSAEWTGGMAFPGFDIVAIGISPGALGWGKRALAHEISHLVVGEFTFNCYTGLPTWLSEGLAVYAEGEESPDSRAQLQRAVTQSVVQDALISVQSLGGSFPADPDQARLAYAESRSLVDFLISQYGRDKMQALLTVFGEGSRADAALRRVYGFDTQGLDTAWRAWLGLGPRPTPPPTPTPQPPTPTPTLSPFIPTLSSTPTPQPSRGLGCQAPLAGGGGWGESLAALAILALPPAAQMLISRRRGQTRSGGRPRPRG